MFNKVLASQVQAPDRDKPLEAAKIPLKNKGLDIASQMRLVKKAKPDHASALGHYSASIEQTLNVIEAIETKLQDKRRQIEKIQTRHEALALEYRQLGKTLESATNDLAEQFAGIITDLETNIPTAKFSGDNAPEKSEFSAEPLAESMPETSEASDLDVETSDLPPLPKFLGDRPKPSNQI